MKIEGINSWLTSGIYAGAMTVYTAILFGFIFRVAWPAGAMFRIFNL